MKTQEILKILVADPSPLLRTGILAIFKRVMRKGIQSLEVDSPKEMESVLQRYTPDVLIVNPSFWGNLCFTKNGENIFGGAIKTVALISSPVSEEVLAQYHTSISIYEKAEGIAEKLETLLAEQPDKQETPAQGNVSAREKEIIACVARGMTNKDIAEKLFLSLHTVITHRRNIARKLEVRSPAGLTIYAIVNKLVSLDEIKIG